MNYQPGIQLGRIVKIHGYDGEVIIKLEKIFIGNLSKMESVFLKAEGKPVPFFISFYEYNGGDSLKIRFRDYDSYDKVIRFKGCQVFLTGSNINKPDDDNDINIAGYTVIQTGGSQIGIIAEVIENPGQILLRIETEAGGETLIPFHEDLITAVDKDNRTIQMDLPEGLTEIN